MVSKVRNFWLCVFSGVVATTLIIDQLKCGTGIRPDPRPPTLFGGPLCERMERGRDIEISGFIYLDTADALVDVKIRSEDLLGPLRPQRP